MTLLGFRLAKKPADKEHPFGHARVEYHAFPSLQGHDAFLVDLAKFEPAIGGFLRG